MDTPEARPFRSEKVITLPIRGANEGSKKPLRPSSRPSAPPTARPSIGLVRLISHLTGNGLRPIEASLGIRVALHHAEQISFGIVAIGEIANGRNSGLRHDLLTAGAGHRGDGLLDGLDVDCVGGCGDVSLFHQAAVNSRRAIWAGGDHPILHWPGPFFDLPAESFLVECRGALRIVRGNFKMYDSRHSSSPVCEACVFVLNLFDLARGCRHAGGRGSIALSRVADDNSHDAAGQDDLQIIAML